MSSIIRIAVAQFNFLVGNITANAEKILTTMREAKQLQADLLVFPELALSGYPPEDLLFLKDFRRQIDTALQSIREQSSEVAVLLGHPHYIKEEIYNAASLIQNGKITICYHKQRLPNSGVFDERRYFLPGNSPALIKIKDLAIGILICEDIWWPEPARALKHAGSELIICINASPFDLHKARARTEVLEARIRETSLPILYVNGVGGQDDLVFDGGSQILSANATLCAQAGFFEERLWVIDSQRQAKALVFQQSFEHLCDSGVRKLDKLASERTQHVRTVLPHHGDMSTQVKHLQSMKDEAYVPVESAIYLALVLSVRDYVDKNHFPGVLLGLSGGIDSALVLSIAVDALGEDRVRAVFSPSRYTSELSKTIVSELTTVLNVRLLTFSIEDSFCSFLNTLGVDLNQAHGEHTIENIQARCRAVLLMALSNQRGELLLNTSNKSELAVGYTTLYGDMIGGFSPLRDIYKTMVYKLAMYRNTWASIFSQALLDRAPSAELAENQYDEQSLPPYAVLDAVLELYVEQDSGLADIMAAGFDREVAEKIINLVDKNEYKRRQAAIGPRATPRAFGRERRCPVTSGFKPVR